MSFAESYWQSRPDAWVACPVCGLPAEVDDDKPVSSTAPPAEEVELRCVSGLHPVLLPADQIGDTP